MIQLLIALTLFSLPAYASCGSQDVTGETDFEVSVCANVGPYVDTESPVTEPEALKEMQAVSALEPASGDERVTYWYTVDEEGVVNVE